MNTRCAPQILLPGRLDNCVPARGKQGRDT